MISYRAPRRDEAAALALSRALAVAAGEKEPEDLAAALADEALGITWIRGPFSLVMDVSIRCLHFEVR